jgi:NADH dehydrogenase [ubiquinone] 1 alpha subcomplex assembly factor 6
MPGMRRIGIKRGQVRWASTIGPSMDLSGAREHCLKLLKEQDRSSYILHSYIPAKARDAFIGVRAFNIETSKIADSAKKQEFAKMRFEFWKGLVQKALSPSLTPHSLHTVPAEPVAMMLAHANAVDNITLSRRFFITSLQTRETFMNNPPFRNVDKMASYGEGTYSQLNYLTQELLYSISPKSSEFLNQNPTLIEDLETVVAHIGQATGIATFLRGYNFFVSRKRFVPLPVDVMAKYDISQEQVLRGEAPQHAIADVVFETATRANDHLISARTELNKLNESLDGTIPDSMFLPAMTSIPVQLYLEKLEKYNFNILDPKLQKNEWRLPYRSYKAYNLRKI